MEILNHPNPVLRQRAAEVDVSTDPDLRRLAAAMAKAMYEAPGIGLAAPQVGVLKRLIVFDLDENLTALCNPRIVERSDETATDDEGCLSLPGIGVPIERAVSVTCEAVDLDGEPVVFQAEDLFARLLQHEIDHLDGVLIIDRATPEERKAALQRYREAIETPL